MFRHDGPLPCVTVIVLESTTKRPATNTLNLDGCALCLVSEGLVYPGGGPGSRGKADTRTRLPPLILSGPQAKGRCHPQPEQVFPAQLILWTDSYRHTQRQPPIS